LSNLAALDKCDATTDGCSEQDSERSGLDWRGRLTSVLIGTAGGMGVNVLSSDVGYRGVAVVAAMAAALTTSTWLRRLPQRAPVVRCAIWALLAASLIGAIAAAFGSPSWAGPVTFAAATATITAALVPSSARTATVLLAGAAFIGGGVAVIGIAVGSLADTPSVGIAIGCFGVAYLGYGAATLMGDIRTIFVLTGRSAWVPLTGFAVASICAGVSLLFGNRFLLGVTCLAGGATGICGGIALLVGNRFLVEIMRIGGGVALTAGGTILLMQGEDLFGVAGVGGGVAAVVAGIANLIESETSYMTTLLCSGLAFLGLGAAFLTRGDALLGAVFASGGVASISGTAILTKTKPGKRVKSWLTAMMQVPESPRHSSPWGTRDASAGLMPQVHQDAPVASSSTGHSDPSR